MASSRQADGAERRQEFGHHQPTYGHVHAGCEQTWTKAKKLGCTSLKDGEGMVCSERCLRM